MKRDSIIKIITLIAIVVILPLEFNAVKKTAQRWQDIRARHEQIKQLTTHNQNLASSLDQHIKVQPFVDLTIPASIDFVKQTEHIEALAQSTGVNVELENLSIDNDAENFLTLVAIINASGQPDQLIRYLDALEHDVQLNVASNWSIKSANIDQSTSW